VSSIVNSGRSYSKHLIHGDPVGAVGEAMPCD
jgi:hypothetical protein